MEETYPIQLLVQGGVKAYSVEQIKDEVERNLCDVLEALFTVEHLAYQVKVGEQELAFTGMKKEDLIEDLARRIYADRQGFCDNILDYLGYLAELLDSESGIIFTHKGTKKAVDATTKLKNNLAHYSCTFGELPIEKQAGYRKAAENILEQTIWWKSGATLLKEG